MKVDWIKCSDRLPEAGDTTWVYRDSDFKSVFLAYFDGKNFWELDRFINEDITHWAEIECPEPPDKL